MARSGDPRGRGGRGVQCPKTIQVVERACGSDTQTAASAGRGSPSACGGASGGWNGVAHERREVGRVFTSFRCSAGPCGQRSGATDSGPRPPRVRRRIPGRRPPVRTVTATTTAHTHRLCRETNPGRRGPWSRHDHWKKKNAGVHAIPSFCVDKRTRQARWHRTATCPALPVPPPLPSLAGDGASAAQPDHPKTPTQGAPFQPRPTGQFRKHPCLPCVPPPPHPSPNPPPSFSKPRDTHHQSRPSDAPP